MDDQYYDQIVCDDFSKFVILVILSHNTSGISYAHSTPVSSDITTNNKMD
jgi:hypothetical protein